MATAKKHMARSRRSHRVKPPYDIFERNAAISKHVKENRTFADTVRGMFNKK